jgi:hypothetical protein
LEVGKPLKNLFLARKVFFSKERLYIEGDVEAKENVKSKR